MSKKHGTVTIGVKVRGREKVQDLADQLREMQQPITIRDNDKVNVYVSNTIIAEAGDGNDA